MSDPNEGAGPQKRRMSLVDMFNGRPNLSSSPPSATVPANPDVAQHRRGTSISALALNTQASGQQTSPYNAFAKQRRASISTSSASSSPEFRNSFGDEPAVIEEDDSLRANNGSPPSPSFARRLSFGAQALRDVRQGGATAPSGGEGFNWSDALRDRTKRSPSFSSSNPFGSGFNRSKSGGAAMMEPPKEIPKAVSPPAKLKKPDHLGERMLRGDFMMD